MRERSYLFLLVYAFFPWLGLLLQCPNQYFSKPTAQYHHLGIIFLKVYIPQPDYKDSLFKKLCRKNWTTTCKRIKFDHYLTSYTKINSKWIKYMNRRPEIIKFLKEDTGRKLLEISIGNGFFFWIWHQKQRQPKKNKCVTISN